MKFSVPTECPYYLVSRVTLVMTSAFKKAFRAAGHGDVRPSYLGALWCLWGNDGVKTVELGRCAGLEPSTMTGLVDRMERDGFAERRPDPDDRRAQLVFLTERGRTLHTTITGIVDETLQRMTSDIPEDDLDTTRRVLEQILVKAQEEDSP